MSNVRRPQGIKPTWFEFLTAVTMYVLGLVLSAWFVPDEGHIMFMVWWGLVVGLTTRDIAHWIRTEL